MVSVLENPANNYEHSIEGAWLTRLAEIVTDITNYYSGNSFEEEDILDEDRLTEQLSAVVFSDQKQLDIPSIYVTHPNVKKSHS